MQRKNEALHARNVRERDVGSMSRDRRVNKLRNPSSNRHHFRSPQRSASSSPTPSRSPSPTTRSESLSQRHLTLCPRSPSGQRSVSYLRHSTGPERQSPSHSHSRGTGEMNTRNENRGRDSNVNEGVSGRKRGAAEKSSDGNGIESP